MSNVLSAELYKLKYNVSFYICMLLCLGANAVGIYLTKYETGEYIFNEMYGMIPLFLSLVIASIVCDDYEKGTMKNLLSSGNGRGAIFGGKLAASLVAGIIFFIVDGVSAVGIAVALNGVGTGISPFVAIESLTAQLLLMIVYTITFYGIATIVRNSKTAIILCVLYYFAVSIAVYMIGKYVIKIDIERFTLSFISRGITDLSFTTTMILDYIIYGAIGIFLCIIGRLRLKFYED